MNKSSQPISRAQKIVNRVFPFFGSLARQHHSDIRALTICQQLIALNGSVLQAPVIAPLLNNWRNECPEEQPLQEHELHWALLELETHLSRQLPDIHFRRPDRAEKKPDRPKLRLIQGGMPAKKVKRGLS